ncbi:MAG: magnesium transporter CorA family protein [Deltaproteobacteria bacterium]|nr:magnesium transporter CorA family protein [Deltaproteobacteria bacterium]
MLARYVNIKEEPGFALCLQGQSADWINLENPTPEELAQVAAELDVPPLFLADPLDAMEKPRVDQEDEATLLIIRLPVHKNDDGDHQFGTIPLGMILVKEKLITVCSKPSLAQDILSRGNRKPRPLSQLKMVMKIFIESSIDFMTHLELMEDITDIAESALSKAQHNEQIMTLLRIDKALINYTVALKSNRAIIKKLLEGNIVPLPEADGNLLDHALTEIQQAIDMAEIYGQILGSLGDAFGNIINNNLNKIMKLLTGVTIILMLPTLIVGAYGMNLVLPMAQHPKAFWIVAILCLLSSGGVWIFFWRKKWI